MLVSSHSRTLWAAVALILLMINVAVLLAPDLLAAVGQVLGL